MTREEQHTIQGVFPDGTIKYLGPSKDENGPLIWGGPQDALPFKTELDANIAAFSVERITPDVAISLVRVYAERMSEQGMGI